MSRFWILLLFVSCSEYDLQTKIPAADGVSEEENDLTPDQQSDDTAVPGEPEAPVEENLPVAVCDVSPNPITPPFESATFDGSASYDPNGHQIVMYYWELVQVPEGSAATLPTFSGMQVPDFMPDLAGDYIAQLTVTNDQGSEDNCQTTLEAIPAQSLWVEMFWVNSGDDMDLHLIAPGVNWSSALESTNDCYYANCVYSFLDWGQQGYAGDDPSLDLDDISGVGPENINVYTPQATGSYTVVVHDYPGSAYQPGNDVTVNIYLNGQLTWTDTRTITGEDSYTPFASVNWSTGSVTGL